MNDFAEFDTNEDPKEGFRAYSEGCIKRQVYINGIGDVQLITTIECEQDMHLYFKNLCSKRTPKITDEEIKDWQEAWKIIKNIKYYDFQKIKDKYKMQILRDEYEDKPYEFWGESDEVMLQGWVWIPGTDDDNWQVR